MSEGAGDGECPDETVVVGVDLDHPIGGETPGRRIRPGLDHAANQSPRVSVALIPTNRRAETLLLADRQRAGDGDQIRCVGRLDLGRTSDVDNRSVVNAGERFIGDRVDQKRAVESRAVRPAAGCTESHVQRVVIGDHVEIVRIEPYAALDLCAGITDRPQEHTSHPGCAFAVVGTRCANPLRSRGLFLRRRLELFLGRLGVVPIGGTAGVTLDPRSDVLVADDHGVFSEIDKFELRE